MYIKPHLVIIYNHLIIYNNKFYFEYKYLISKIKYL